MAKDILASELAAWRRQGLPVVVIDVRFDQIGTIPGSVHVPVTDLEDKEWDWEKTTKLVVCCQYGRGASEYAAEVLEEQGYKEVYKLKGGLDAWIAEFNLG